MMHEGVSEVMQFASTSTTMTRLSNVAQQGLGDGRGLMDLCWMVAPSGIVVALRTSLLKINMLIRSEDGLAKDDGNDF
jgi:hypothetical protein